MKYRISRGFMNKLERKLTVAKRRWLWMPTLDGYVLREYMTYFSILIFVFAMLFFLSDVFNDLADFLDHKASWSQIFYYFALRIPGNMQFVFPIAVLLGCMWTMAIFGKHMEVTAMRASGVSLVRCGRMIFVVGFLVSCLNFYFNEQLVPYTTRRADVFKDLITKGGGKFVSFQTMLTYRNFDPEHPRTWFFRNFGVENKHDMVLVKNFRPNGTLDWHLLAQSASYDQNQGWIFNDVLITQYSEDGLMPLPSEHLDQLIKSPAELPESAEDIVNSVKDVKDLPSWVIYDLLQRMPNMAASRRATFETVFFYRLAFPWASFLAVFLGLPLATKNERSGILLSLISSVAVIVGYIALSQVFLLLGQKEMLPPIIAGLLPTIGFIAYGYYKVRCDNA